MLIVYYMISFNLLVVSVFNGGTSGVFMGIIGVPGVFHYKLDIFHMFGGGGALGATWCWCKFVVQI